MIELRKGHWFAAIDPDCGARVLSLRYKNEPVLREPENTDELSSEPLLYGMPFLFPPNRVADGHFTFDGKDYRLPINEPARNNHIHGLFAGASFMVLGSGPDRVITHMESKGEYFPFPCEVAMTDSLDKEGFCRKTQVTNTGAGDMPVEIGFHTAFAAPGEFMAPISRRRETDDRFIPTGDLLPLDGTEQEIAAGRGPRGGRGSGVYTAKEGSAGRMAQIGEFTYEVSEKFTDWVLFSRAGEGWVCVEPQTGPVNELNRYGCRRLRPGESLCLWQKISLLKKRKKGDNEEYSP